MTTSTDRGSWPDRDHAFIDLHGRVTALENKDAQNSTELALLKRDIAYIKVSQDKVTSGINRLLWIVIGSVVAAASTFILSGGLVIVQ